MVFRESGSSEMVLFRVTRGCRGIRTLNCICAVAGYAAGRRGVKFGHRGGKLDNEKIWRAVQGSGEERDCRREI